MAVRIRPSLVSRALTPRSSYLPSSQLYNASIRHRPLTTSSTTSSTSTSSDINYWPANSTPISQTGASPSSATSQSTESPSPSTSFTPLPYHVHRTSSQQLPIYHLTKAGGNKLQTRIRRISGSVEELKKDLKAELGLADRDIAINSVNGHIVIRGWKKFEVARFLQERHF